MEKIAGVERRAAVDSERFFFAVDGGIQGGAQENVLVPTAIGQCGQSTPGGFTRPTLSAIVKGDRDRNAKRLRCFRCLRLSRSCAAFRKRWTPPVATAAAAQVSPCRRPEILRRRNCSTTSNTVYCGPVFLHRCRLRHLRYASLHLALV